MPGVGWMPAHVGTLTQPAEMAFEVGRIDPVVGDQVIP